MTSFSFFSSSAAKGFSGSFCSFSPDSSPSAGVSSAFFCSGSDEYHLVDDTCRDDAPKGEIGVGRIDRNMEVLEEGAAHVLKALLCLRSVLWIMVEEFVLWCDVGGVKAPRQIFYFLKLRHLLPLRLP